MSSLLSFGALHVLVVLLSIEGQRALGFHQKNILICVQKMNDSFNECEMI